MNGYQSFGSKAKGHIYRFPGGGSGLHDIGDTSIGLDIPGFEAHQGFFVDKAKTYF